MPELSLRLNELLLRKLANAVLFQCGWFVCVLGGDAIALAFTLGCLAIHQVLMRVDYSEWVFIAGVTVMGLIGDSVFSYFGLMVFESPSLGLIPIWLLCLWVLFATTLNHSLEWLRGKYLLAALFGAVAAPISYFAGAQLAQVEFGSPTYGSLMVLSVYWAALLPLLYVVAGRWVVGDKLQG